MPRNAEHGDSVLAMASRQVNASLTSSAGRLWFKLYTPEQMTYETLQMASDLGRHDDVQRLAPGLLASASTGGMLRRLVICTTTLASSYLPSDGNPHGDIDRACDLLSQVIPSLGSLSSTRALEGVNSVSRALAPHAGRPSVQEVENRFRSRQLR